jgi:hypothetical protein
MGDGGDIVQAVMVKFFCVDVMTLEYLNALVSLVLTTPAQRQRTRNGISITGILWRPCPPMS